MIIERIGNILLATKEFKDYMKIEYNDDDNIIEQYLWTAIEICERESGSLLVKSSCEYTTQIPANKRITLPEFPVTKLTSVEIKKGEEITELKPKSTFISESRNLVLLIENTQSESAVTIQYEAGLEKVPMFIITAVKIIASNLYDNKIYKDGDLGELMTLLRTLNTTALV